MPSLLLYGVLALAIIGSLSGIAYKIHDAGYQKAAQECKDAAAAQRVKDEKQIAVASDRKESADAKAKVVYRTITKSVDKIVDRPVYVRQCFDADGVRLVGDALSGRSSAAPGKPDRSVPRPDPAK